MTLSKRLQIIHDMINYDAVVADVGSDHGKLMIALFESGTISHGYAIENKKGPYNRLVKALEEAHIIDDVVPLLSDGISELPPKVDTVVLAGMGGNLIINILTSHKEKLKGVSTIIVDAHSCLSKVREEITQLGYVIADEKMVKEDNVFYEIIKFIKADIAFYSEKDLEYGPILIHEKSATFKEKYQNRINEIDHLLHKKGLPNARIKELEKERTEIIGIL